MCICIQGGRILFKKPKNKTVSGCPARNSYPAPSAAPASLASRYGHRTNVLANKV